MRAGLPSENTRGRTITLYNDKEPLDEALGVSDEESIHAYQEKWRSFLGQRRVSHRREWQISGGEAQVHSRLGRCRVDWLGAVPPLCSSRPLLGQEGNPILMVGQCYKEASHLNFGCP